MNILIIDDHPMVRQGLRMTLQDAGIIVKDEAGCGEDGIVLLQSNQYDLVIIDIDLPDISGLEVITNLRTHNAGLPILVLSLHPEKDHALRSIKAGADGYLSKTASPEALLSAVHRLINGGKVFSPEVMYALLKHAGEAEVAAAHDALSDREYQVMCLIAVGHHISEIARRLKITPTTVSTYRTRILDKLALNNNADLTRYALAHKLIS